jgi:hypothetical protein
MRVLRDTLGNLPNDAFAHAFQEGMPIKLVGGEDLRYLASSDIESDPDVKAVFFKTSLNTGWDCPRAEVMMSFRTAADATYIAQLVGRMVRTALAHRVGADEALNTVALFLPHYNSKGFEAVNWDVGSDSAREGDTVQVDIAAENVDDLFEAVGRQFGEGLHKVWWRERVREDATARERAKLELFALCMDPDVARKVEKAAQGLVQKWLKEHGAAIAALDEGSRASYDEVRNLAAVPELTPLTYPATIQVKAAETVWEKHLYVDDDGKFPEDLNAPETDLLGQELGRKDVLRPGRRSCEGGGHGAVRREALCFSL